MPSSDDIDIPKGMWWPLWRLVLEGHWSPRELRTWSMMDILRTNDLLDIKAYVERKAHEKHAPKKSRV